MSVSEHSSANSPTKRHHADIQAYHEAQSPADKEICELLATAIDNELSDAESKIWHAHPVWFLEGNPIVGYSKLKAGIRLMFWSGADFGEERLKAGTGKFKDASITYTDVEQVDLADLKRWLRHPDRCNGTTKIW